MNEKRRIILAYCCYFIGCAMSFAINFETMHQSNRFWMTFAAIGSISIVPIFLKVFHFKGVEEIHYINVVFCFFAALIGSCFGGYGVKYFDKWVHFGFGFIGIELSAMLFFLLYRDNELIEQRIKRIFIIFINAVNVMMAVFWEFYEYALLVFFKNDAVNHYTTGVHDTMTDMVVCTLGGLIVTIFWMSYLQKGKQNYFSRLVERMYLLNKK